MSNLAEHADNGIRVGLATAPAFGPVVADVLSRPELASQMIPRKCLVFLRGVSSCKKMGLLNLENGARTDQRALQFENSRVN